MPRTQQSHKRRASSSFTKFVARLQHTFSSKNIKSSTPVIPPQLFHQINHRNPVLPTFPSFSNPNYPRFHLSDILYDPSHQVEYLSEIEEKTSSDLSEQSIYIEDNDSCYDSLSDHRNEKFNLSQMNISMNVNYYQQQHSQPNKFIKLPNSFDTARFHSTAIHDIGHF